LPKKKATKKQENIKSEVKETTQKERMKNYNNLIKFLKQSNELEDLMVCSALQSYTKRLTNEM